MPLPSYRHPYPPVPYAQPESPSPCIRLNPTSSTRIPPSRFPYNRRFRQVPGTSRRIPINPRFPQSPNSPRNPPPLLLPLFSILGDNALPVADRAQAAMPTPVEADGVVLVTQCVREVGGLNKSPPFQPNVRLPKPVVGRPAKGRRAPAVPEPPRGRFTAG